MVSCLPFCLVDYFLPSGDVVDLKTYCDFKKITNTCPSSEAESDEWRGRHNSCYWSSGWMKMNVIFRR